MCTSINVHKKYKEKRANPPQRSRIDLEGGWVEVRYALHFYLHQLEE